MHRTCDGLDSPFSGSPMRPVWSRDSPLNFTAMWKHFLESAEGIRAVHRRQELRTVRLHIEGIEPSSKRGMPPEDKAKLQQYVANELASMNRLAFRGPIAIDIWAGTTQRNPSHVQSLAKNLLDLLAKPDHIKHTSNALLFRDDNQVQGLSVRCDHGNAEPFIWITASPFSSVLLSMHLLGMNGDTIDDEARFDPSDLDMNRRLLRDLERNPNDYEASTAKQLHRWYRAEVQASWLQGSSITPTELGGLYPHPVRSQETWRLRSNQPSKLLSDIFHVNRNRIFLPELPQQDGESRSYKEYVRKAFKEYRAGFGRHLFPMDTPLAIEVIIKPPPIQRQRGLHDLDNVCRDYLIPSLVELFSPPQVISSTLPTPGAGLIGYEAWRLARSADDSSPGFVSISLVSDLYGKESLLHRIERDVEKVLDQLE